MYEIFVDYINTLQLIRCNAINRVFVQQCDKSRMYYIINRPELLIYT